MKTKKLNKKIFSLLMAGIITSISIMPVNAATTKANEAVTVSTLEEKYDLETVSSIPDGVIPVKFNNANQAEEFIKTVIKNEKAGKTLDLSDYVSKMKKNEKYGLCVDLSDVELSDDDFVEDQKVEDQTGTNVVKSSSLQKNSSQKNSKIYALATTYNGVESGSVDVSPLESMQIQASVTYSSSNHKYVSCRSVTSFLNGFTLGNSWEQTDYSANITNWNRRLSVTVYGQMSHYILINTSLTKLGSEPKSYNITWNTF